MRADGNEGFTGEASPTSRVRVLCGKTLVSPLKAPMYRCDSSQGQRHTTSDRHDMTATAIRSHLETLAEERAAAVAWGADSIPAYIADLDAEIDAYRAAYVGAAVTEIATFRAQLSGPQVG